MCGIIGYVGPRKAAPLLEQGLEHLEYRGYDSAGIATIDGRLHHLRVVGNFAALKELLAEASPEGHIGLGHTRWATHGGVSERNAHPLTGCDSDVLVVLNGIVENFRELRAELQAAGHAFSSETDAEVVPHLIEDYYKGDLVEAVRRAYQRLEGNFSFVVMHTSHPDMLVGVRNQAPLLIGRAEGENFIASAIAAFLPETRRFQLIEDGEVVAVTADGVSFYGAEVSSDGEPEIEREEQTVDWDQSAATKEGYETFMLKEINEQADVLQETIGEHLRHGRVEFADLGIDPFELRQLERIVVVSCGTSYHSGVAARYALEAWSGIPAEFDVASEWRYRDPIVSPNTLVIGISQSGETADTLAAMRLAKEKGARTLAVTNMLGSQITRDCDATIFTRCGLERSVAATKTFSAQVVLLYLFGLYLAQIRGTLEPLELEVLEEEIAALPAKAQDLLDRDLGTWDISSRIADQDFFLYLGRHVGLPVALEGALKLKEISYIPTEAYSAGEMKHGPIALLGDGTPVVCVATDGHVYEKMISNIQEVRARGAYVIAVATDGNEDITHHADQVLYIPRTHPLLQAVLAIIPLQLLAYRIARHRGLNVDQPRNLAKTVTVE
jgi:glucosamine--fructose-6-phosphate aminotransferase (isomerizing)